MSDTSDPKAQERVGEDEVERLSKVYAEATGYYVEFHRGLDSVSSNKIRNGIRAVIAQTARERDALREEVERLSGLLKERTKWGNIIIDERDAAVRQRDALVVALAELEATARGTIHSREYLMSNPPQHIGVYSLLQGIIAAIAASGEVK